MGILDAVEDEDDGVGACLDEGVEVGFVVDIDLRFAGGGGLAMAVGAGGAHEDKKDGMWAVCKVGG